jgi:pimeloyl-ACP methyl ester carboxylesterase
MASSILTIENFVFESPQQGGSTQPFKIAAKRYTDGSCRNDGVTLVLVHGTGFHKECWEPTLEKLMALQSNASGDRAIREAWSFDAPSHGDSAVLNAETLNHRMDNVSVSEIGGTIVSLVDSQYLKGHRIIVIGHSAGSSAAMYSTKFYPSEDIPYDAIILIEPPMIDKDVFNQHLRERQGQIGHISKALIKQKDIWPNREAARAWLTSRLPWKTWDGRVLDLYIKHALKEIKQTTEIATKCSRRQEVHSFSDFEATFEALDQIAPVCKETPIYVLFGGINDMVPRYSQDTVVDVSKGRNVASVVRISGTGHMIVQQHPQILAENLSKLLYGTVSLTKL